MPRFNSDGKTVRFLNEINEMERNTNSSFRGRGFGGYGRGHGRGASGKAYRDLDDVGSRGSRRGSGHVTFNFTSDKSRSIMRKPKPTNQFHTSADDDGDVKMDGAAGGFSPTKHQGKYGPSGYNANSFRGKKWRQLRQDQGGSSDFRRPNYGPSWHKIMITSGSQFSRDFVLQSFNSACLVPFIPIAYTVLGVHSIFFVEDRTQAEALFNCSRQLKTPDGQRMDIKVMSCGTPPSIAISPEVEERVRAVLATRYNPTVPSLTLENFGLSPDIRLDFYLPLFRPMVASLIFRLLDTMLTSLSLLDLSNNKLVGLDNFTLLPKKAPNLRGLNLATNKIQELYQLEKLKGLELQELNVQNNPLCEKYDDQASFISLLRKIFPKLIKLDGVEMAPQISFDVEEPTRLPATKPSYFCNEQAKKVVLTFVEQYIQLYDSDDRQPLLAAYHESAVMTLCSANTKDSSYGNASDPATRLHKYIGDSRNLLRLNDKSRKFKLFHVGKLDIVAFLTKLPKTLHDTSSFVIDMPLAMDSFITFSLFGVFKEREEKEQLIRSFQRTFNLVPQNNGFSIVNEMLHVQNPTSEQHKAAFKVPAPTPSPSPNPYVQDSSAQLANISNSLTNLTIPTAPDDEMKRQMVVQFAKQSAMNEDWSRKCLEENGWNYENSGHIFTELHKLGRIPPEAFVK